MELRVMLKAVEGRYRDGELILDEEVPEGVEARAILYFPVAGPVPEQPDKRDRWAAVCGVISDEDAEQMLRAIEEGCERVDPREWEVPC